MLWPIPISWPIPIRYIVYVISTLCITLIYAFRLAFHTTIICQLENSTDSFLHDNNLRQYTFQSVGIGLAVGLVPLHFLQFLGTRYVTTIFGFIGILSSIAYPTCHKLGFWPSFTARLFQGIPLVIILWLVAKISSEWAPRSEVGVSIAILTSVYQFAPFVAQVTAAEMCTRFGWELAYYVLAAAAALAHLAFFVVHHADRVQDNRFVGEEEKRIIAEGKGDTKGSKGVGEQPPYSQLIADPTVWICWFANLAFFSTMLLFLQFGPIYMNRVLGFPVQLISYLSGLAHILCLLGKLQFGRLIDMCKIDMTKRMRLAWLIIEIPTIALLVSMVLYSQELYQMLAIVLIITIHGMAIVVIVKVQTLHAGEHSHILANGNTFCVVMCLFVQPLIVKLFVVDDTFREWSTIFALQAIILSLSVVLFVSLVDARPASWTQLRKVDTGVA